MRSELEIFKEVFSLPVYHQYSNFTSHIDDLLKLSNKQVLNMELPDQLIFEVLSRSKRYIYLEPGDKVLYSYETLSTNKKISLFEAYKILGTSKLDELLERSQLKV